ncbi:UTRA domain-containing protein [Streptomyces sp. NPDC006207]
MTDPGWTGSSTPYLKPSMGDTWQQEAATAGGRGGQRILFAGEVNAPAEIARALGVAPGTAVGTRRRLVLLDDRPVEVADSYWPADVARGTALTEQRKIRGGAVSLLTELGYTPGSVDERIATRPPTRQELQDLRIADEAEWVLTLTRVIANQDGTPYEVTAMVMPGRIGRLNYSMKVD